MQPIGTPTTEQSIDVDAPPEVVWAILADVMRTPEWSPVCHRCEWIDGHREPVEGARFRGHNRLNGARWSRDCVVTSADPGQLFAFSALFKGQESTRWRYRTDALGAGTRLSEAYEIVMVPPWLRALRRLPGVVAKTTKDTEHNISTSLERLKALAEGTAGATR